MPPPELTADAPVLDVFHPVEVGLLPALGTEGDLVLGHGIGRFRYAGITQEPLHGNARFDRDIGAFGVTDGVLVFLDLHELAHGLQLLRSGLAAAERSMPSNLGPAR